MCDFLVRYSFLFVGQCAAKKLFWARCRACTLYTPWFCYLHILQTQNMLIEWLGVLGAGWLRGWHLTNGIPLLQMSLATCMFGGACPPLSHVVFFCRLNARSICYMTWQQQNNKTQEHVENKDVIWNSKVLGQTFETQTTAPHHKSEEQISLTLCTSKTSPGLSSLPPRQWNQQCKPLENCMPKANVDLKGVT